VALTSLMFDSRHPSFSPLAPSEHGVFVSFAAWDSLTGRMAFSVRGGV
jgi:hypothetical protein